MSGLSWLSSLFGGRPKLPSSKELELAATPAAAPEAPADKFAALQAAVAKVPAFESTLPRDAPQAAVDALFRVGAFPDLYAISSWRGAVPAARVDLAEKCLGFQQQVTTAAARETLARYSYSTASRGKCVRDIGIVYQWCVYCMLIGNLPLLERHFLRWLRMVFEHLGFPEGNRSVAFAYSVVRAEMMQRLEPDEQAMIAPYLDSVITAMSRGAAK
jgi:hypothetical protein